MQRDEGCLHASLVLRSRGGCVDDESPAASWVRDCGMQRVQLKRQSSEDGVESRW